MKYNISNHHASIEITGIDIIVIVNRLIAFSYPLVPIKTDGGA